MLKKDFFSETIDQLYKELLYLVFYFQGEPYLNPDFLEMVKYASSKKIYTATSTNAHYLNDENAKRTIESGLDRLIISIDGTTSCWWKPEQSIRRHKEYCEMEKRTKEQNTLYHFSVPCGETK